MSAQGHGRVERYVEVSGSDQETLLVNWLNELLYLSERFQERYDGFEILDLTDERLRARLCGTQREATAPLVKAVTFHNLAIKREGAEWIATLVVDV
jgi:SHS2 domain-containing protein